MSQIPQIPVFRLQDHCVSVLGFDPLLLILKARWWIGTNSNQLEIEQLCDGPGCTCRSLTDLNLGSRLLSSLPSWTTWPPTTAYRNPCSLSRALNANCVQLSTVLSHNHSCRTRKRQCNQAPGIPYYHNHAITTAQPFCPTHPICFYPVSFSHCHSLLKL